MEEKGRRKTQEEEYGGGWGRRDMMPIKSIFKTVIDQKGISDTQLPNICYCLSSFSQRTYFYHKAQRAKAKSASLCGMEPATVLIILIMILRYPVTM